MGRGRPRNDFGDKEMKVVYEAAGLFSSKEEIAEILLLPLDVLEKRVLKFTKKTLDEHIRKAESMRKMELKRTMFKLSERNGTVAVYLSKTYIEEKDDEKDESFEGLEIEITDGADIDET
jgi:adenine-specific DNA methylase